MEKKINPISKAFDYVRGVESGEISLGLVAKLSVKRFQNDLERGADRGLVFDENAAQVALDFFECLCFTKGKWKGKPFSLEPWQAFIVANVFGWKDVVTGNRRFTEIYIEVPKKNGKTELAAGIGLYMLVLDEENTPEVYAAAYTRDQAGICFKAAKSMARQSEYIRNELDIFANSIYCDYNEGSMLAVSHDANNTEGKHSSCVIFDEYHVHKTDDVKTSLRSGMAAREQPIFFTITTAGANRQLPCYSYRTECIVVLEDHYERDNLFAMIFNLDEGDSWEDPEMWAKANPNYGVSVRPKFLEDEFKKAKKNGREEVEFKTKHLNMWVDSAVTWIPSETWKKLAKPDFAPEEGAVCYAGLDLGYARDIASFALYFPDYDFLAVKHYCSEHAAEYASRPANINYLDWVKAGYLIATPGMTTNYEYIFNDIVEAASTFDFRFLGYDPFSAQMLKQKLEAELGTTYAAVQKEDGSINYDYHNKVQAFRQGFISMGPATKLFEETVLNEKLFHDGNPITAWMLGNVALATDAAGNIKPVKDKSNGKIDGIVASIMALGEYSIWHLTTDTYANSKTYGIY
ncbi:Phage terminase-like protein, large subunit, contains N-terminal HTH domain [Dyadobacter soli]|uniref:Phage terminase-like protein, large subunit, contains N-terminal HTH domain n=1 Tax=Dyadobacter soli TaxID=659014 RepID=A0A1G7G491_9BACT|nr:terminase TerL endonuclease subunit [Dyadobacter soli]SDE82933.1 Phage terminase-like protein, large subunit, contains N-terminal HTH domain [Dyadobacter soli]